jgi:hypothetical protein
MRCQGASAGGRSAQIVVALATVWRVWRRYHHKSIRLHSVNTRKIKLIFLRNDLDSDGFEKSLIYPPNTWNLTNGKIVHESLDIIAVERKLKLTVWLVLEDGNEEL